MSYIEKMDLSKGDKSEESLGSLEYRECLFKRTDLTNSEAHRATFLACDFTGAGLIGITLKMSCRQGHANKLDELNICMFLYWLMYFVDLPSNYKSKIEDIIGSRLPMVKNLFERELSPL